MTITLIFVFIVALFMGLKWLSGPSLGQFPSPKGWPIFGNALQVNLKRPFLTFVAWGKQLGDVFAVKMFHNSFVVLNSFESIHEALVTKGHHFAGRPHKGNFRIKYGTDNYQDLICSNPCARWNLIRKTCHRQIKMYGTGLQRIENINIDIIQSMVQGFRKQGHKPFNPREMIYNAVMNIMTTFLVGRRYSVNDKVFQLFTEVERLSISTTGASGEGVELDIFPFVRFFGNKTYRQLTHLKAISAELWSLIRDEARETMGDPEAGVVQTLLSLPQNQIQGQNKCNVPLEETHLRLTTMNLLIAGTTTTSNSLYAYFNTISQYADVQSKLQAEVDEVVGAARPVAMHDRPNMPYTQATVLELLRFSSVAHMGVPHATLQDTSIQGKHIPAGVMVLTNLWALHHDEDFWDSPYEFKPERFLDEDGNLVSPSHENRRHLMPFGAGPRVCVGEVLAMGRLFLFIATIAQVFHVSQDPVVVSSDARRYRGGAVIHPDDYEITVRSRNDKLFAL